MIFLGGEGVDIHNGVDGVDSEGSGACFSYCFHFHPSKSDVSYFTPFAGSTSRVVVEMSEGGAGGGGWDSGDQDVSSSSSSIMVKKEWRDVMQTPRPSAFWLSLEEGREGESAGNDVD